MAPKRKAAESVAGPASKRSKQHVAAAPQASPLKRKAEEEESSAGPASKRSRRGNDAAIDGETVVASIEVDIEAEKPWDATAWRRSARARQASLRKARGKVARALKPAVAEISARETRAVAARQERFIEEQRARMRLEEAEAALYQQRMQREREQRELLIHWQVGQMEAAWTRINGPIVGGATPLSQWPNDRATVAAQVENPLFSAANGQGRFYIEAAEMYKDWQERLSAAPSRRRATIAPRPYEEVRAARLDQFNRLRAENAARVSEEMRVKAQNQWRVRDLPPIPRLPAVQHPFPVANRSRGKWSKRQRSPVSTLLELAAAASLTPSPPPE